MEIVVGKLSAHYKGRGESHLAPYNRIVILKDDGSVCIHGDSGYKPMNYMMPPASKVSTVVDGNEVWTITGKNETLTITFYSMEKNFSLSLGNEDPGLTRITTEHHLQEWLHAHPEVFGDHVLGGVREYQTGKGPIDLFFDCYGGAGLAVEVKRVAALNTVGQLLRYVDALEEKFPGRPIEGVITALEFKQSVLELAAKKKITCLQVPAEWQTLPHDQPALQAKLIPLPFDPS